jgi:flagellar basal body rod protein FlgG
MTSNAIRRPLLTLATIGIVITFTACGNAAESGVEQLIESQGGGDVDLDLDGDGGFSVETEEGGMSIDEDGNFVITDADGSVVTGNADSESGDFTAETEDGSFRIDASGEIPEEWPSDVPSPEGIDGASSTVSQSATELAITVTGQADETFVEDYGSTLEANGFERTSNFESEANITRVYENGTWTVSVNSFPDGDTSQIAISLFPVSS